LSWQRDYWMMNSYRVVIGFKSGKKTISNIIVHAATDSTTERFTPLLSVAEIEGEDIRFIAPKGNRWFETKEGAIEYGHTQIERTIRDNYGLGKGYVVASALHAEILEFEEPTITDKILSYLSDRRPKRHIKDPKV